MVQTLPDPHEAALATDFGRASFWAETAPERDDRITFHILNYEPFPGRVLRRVPPVQLSLEYFGTIVVAADGCGGTELSLVASQVNEAIRMEMAAGWVRVLMAMKAAVDHAADFRNHDANRSWMQGYADN
jgi:hypothetical protein